MQETKGMDHVGTERVLCTSGYHLSVQKVGTQMNNDKMCCYDMRHLGGYEQERRWRKLDSE